MEDVVVKTPKAKKGKTPKKSVTKKQKSPVVEVEAAKAQDEIMEDVVVSTPKAKKSKTPKKSVTKKKISEDPETVVADTPVKKLSKISPRVTRSSRKARKPSS